MANVRVKDAAEYLGVSKSLLDKLRCYGGGPRYAKLGAMVIYSTSDLDDWLAAHSRTSTADNDNARDQREAA